MRHDKVIHKPIYIYSKPFPLAVGWDGTQENPFFYYS